MEPEVLKYRLKKSYTDLLRDLEPRKLLSYLYQEDIFDEEDMDEVRDERTRKKQAETMLSILSRKDIQGYGVLLDALIETQPHLAKLLQTPIPEEKKEKRSKGTSYLDEIKGMVERLNSQPTEHDVNAGMPLPSTGYFGQSYREGGTTINLTPDAIDSAFVQPTKWAVISDLYRPNSLESVYKMTSSPRGLAVIINFENFDVKPEFSPEEKLEKREGSTKDADELSKLFTALDFEIEKLVDLTRDELLSTLGKISTWNFSRHDCFVLCLMSHGKRGFFYTRDGGKIFIETILKMFNNTHCETLCGKPKLYFIQACRGKDTDIGTIVRDAPSANPTENEEAQKPPKKREYMFDIKKPKGPSTGEQADQLVAYSSVEGYSSFRNTRSGSRFIRSLVQVFRDYACVEDVLSMLTRVISRVNSQGDVGSKQVPKPETTLTRKVFFWPGIKFDDGKYLLSRQ